MVSTILLRTNLPTIHLHVLHLCIYIGIVSKSMSTNALSVIVLNEAANIQRYENGLYPRTLIASISLLYPQLTSQWSSMAWCTQHYCLLIQILTIRVCVDRNAFMELKSTSKSSTQIGITRYSTAAKCLGDLVEYFYLKQQSIKDQYRLVLDKEHISLIELCREYDKVSLLSATKDIEQIRKSWGCETSLRKPENRLKAI